MEGSKFVSFFELACLKRMERNTFIIHDYPASFSSEIMVNGTVNVEFQIGKFR